MEAVKSCGGKASYQQIRRYSEQSYSGINEPSFRADVYRHTVNWPGRIHYTANQKPRPADNPKEDILYRTPNGDYELYDRQRHGDWEIKADASGKLVVALVTPAGFKPTAAMRTTPVYWMMVKEAVEALGKGSFPQVRQYLREKYGAANIHEPTLQAHLYQRSVNYPNRIDYAGNKKPRLANDPRCDSLFWIRGGQYELYNQRQHGVWEIKKDNATGKLIVAQVAPISTGQSTLSKDIKAIISTKTLDGTTKEALVNARVGQGAFRSTVLQLWNQRCSVTGSVTLDAIRASHIKPWRDSTNSERLDPENGLPLVASLDALFDAGLISFDASGLMRVSSELGDVEREIYGLGKKKLVKRPTAATAEYLRYHNTTVYRG